MQAEGGSKLYWGKLYKMNNYDYLEFQYSDGNLPWCLSMVKEWLDPDIVLAMSEPLNEETSTETFLIQE